MPWGVMNMPMTGPPPPSTLTTQVLVISDGLDSI